MKIDISTLNIGGVCLTIDGHDLVFVDGFAEKGSLKHTKQKELLHELVDHMGWEARATELKDVLFRLITVGDWPKERAVIEGDAMALIKKYQ